MATNAGKNVKKGTVKGPKGTTTNRAMNRKTTKGRQTTAGKAVKK